MQIFIGQAGQKSGPFSEEQLRSMVRYGSLPETTPVWHEGMADWCPLNEVFKLSPPVPTASPGGLSLEKPASSPVSPPPLPPPSPLPRQTIPIANPLENLRDRSEPFAKGVCLAISGIVLLVLLATGGIFFLLPVLLAQWVSSFLFAASLKGGAVLIGPHSWPELNKIVEETKAKLNIREASAYIIQDTMFNAFATRLAGRNFIVLNSGAVDALLNKGKLEDIKFLVGHECGHVALGHVNFLGGVLPSLCLYFAYPVYAWYRRCQERSADRCGLWSAGNRADAHRSVAVLVGGSEMGSRLSVHAMTDQWNAVRDELWITIVRFLSEYPHTTERVILLHQAADELGLP
jgi:Zn-dependent protease with chaperone function